MVTMTSTCIVMMTIVALMTLPFDTVSALSRTNRDAASVSATSDRVKRPTRSLTAEIVNSTTITLKGLPQNGGESVTCPITRYLIRLKQQGAKRVRTLKVEGVRQTVSLHGLLADTIYNVRLVTVTCEGRSKPSRWITIRTTDPATSHGIGQTSGSSMHEMSAPGEPKNVATQVFVDSVLVSWKAPEDSAVVRGYVVGYGEGVPDVNWQYIEGHRRNVTVRNLKKGTQYVISVRAFNNVGKGPVVYELVYTNENPGPSSKTLQAPVNVKTKVLTPTTVMVEWSDATLPGAGSRQTVTDNRYYSVHYQATTGSQTSERSETSRKMQVMLNGLLPATKYEFRVRMVKDGQQSPFSNTVVNRTFETVPGSPPRSVTVTMSANDREASTVAAIVQWRPPRLSNGNITDYMIQYTDNVELPYERWQSLMVRQKTEGTIDGLQKAKIYYFRVQARNSFGYGPKSDIIKLITTIPEPTVAADEAGEKLSSSSSSSVASTTDSSVVNSNSSSQDAILIALNETEDDDYDYAEGDKEGDKKDIETASLVQDAAHTDANKRKREPSLTSPETEEPVPDESDTSRTSSNDVAFRVLVTYKVSAYITWPEHPDACGKRGGGLGYRLRYRRQDETGESAWTTKSLSENLVLLDNLEPNTKYVYQVKYMLKAPWSQEQEFDTTPSNGTRRP